LVTVRVLAKAWGGVQEEAAAANEAEVADRGPNTPGAHIGP